MVPGRNSEALGIVELALAFHRAPTRHADLLHGRTPLPPGVDTLLKLAGGSGPEPGYAALARPDELKAAALFFIEQVLFRHDVSHYRVLGLEPGASLDQIKEHHRLLMRVFHPDRENRTDDWSDAFATHINLAYTSLRDPDARRRYYAALKLAARQGTPPHPARRAAHAPRPAPLSRMSGLPPIVLRYLPQWVLAGTALVAFAVVGAVYLNNPPAPTVHAGVPARFAAPLPETPVAHAPVVETVIAAAEDPELPSEPEALPQPPASIPPPEPVPVSVPSPLPKPEPKPVPLPAREPAPRPAPKPAPGPVLAKLKVPAATPVKIATRPALHETPAAPSREAVHRPPVVPAAVPRPAEDHAPKFVASVAPAPAPEPPVVQAAPPEPRVAVAAARPGEPDPNAMLAQFMSSYERGDTQAFMALFDEVAIGRVGGKPQIRRQHDSLFRSTDLRHLDIEGMAWSKEGDWIRGEGRYRKTLMPKGELRLQTETGIFRIELLRRGEDALIMGLDYLPGGRS
jgi:hypothetical protein